MTITFVIFIIKHSLSISLSIPGRLYTSVEKKCGLTSLLWDFAVCGHRLIEPVRISYNWDHTWGTV